MTPDSVSCPRKWPVAVFSFPQQPLDLDIAKGSKMILAITEQEWAFFTLDDIDRDAGTLDIACADGVYHVHRLQPAGKKPMDAQAFACGYLGKLAPGVPLVCPAPADLLD